jgi:hypothetical protein
MVGIIDEITKLTDEWYYLIGKDHHKDRDCHWYIETKWSYGHPPKYFVQHFGYILDDVQILCDSYDEALKKLKEYLEYAIQQEKYENTGC